MIDNVTQFFSTVSSWAVAITAIIACLSAIFKPIRIGISKIFGLRKGTDEIKDELIGVKKNMSDIKFDIEQIKKTSISRDADIKNIKDDMISLGAKLQNVSDENDENEKSRIRRDIMKYGDVARRGEPISPRVFESIRQDYENYKCHLHGNGVVTEEYEFIRDYYNANFSKWG